MVRPREQTFQGRVHSRLTTTSSLHPDCPARGCNFSAADDLYKQALTLRNEVFGESDPKTLNTISRIASLRYQQNRLTDMEQLLQIVLQGYKALPSCAPEVVAITVELAELSRDQCKLHKAEREGEKAVRFGTTQLGSDHPDVKAAKLSLAGTKEFLGKLSEAATLYNEVLDSESKFCGAESPRSLNIAFCQGNLLTLQKQFDEAGPILERTLQG